MSSSLILLILAVVLLVCYGPQLAQASLQGGGIRGLERFTVEDRARIEKLQKAFGLQSGESKSDSVSEENGFVTASTQQKYAVNNCGFGQYDFSDMASAPDMVFDDPQFNRWFLRPCGAVTNGSCLEKSANAMVCQYAENVNTAHVVANWEPSAAEWNVTTVDDDTPAISLHIANGELCGVNPRQVTIYFVCDPSATFTSGAQCQEVGSGTCVYMCVYPTTITCDGSKKSLSGGWIFVIIIAVVTTVYIIGGVAFMHFRRGPGVSKCPNLGFWKGFGGLVKDGCIYSKDKMLACFAGGKGTSYQTM